MLKNDLIYLDIEMTKQKQKSMYLRAKKLRESGSINSNAIQESVRVVQTIRKSIKLRADS